MFFGSDITNIFIPPGALSCFVTRCGAGCYVDKKSWTCDSLLTIFANWMKDSGTDCLTDLSQNEIGRNYQYRLTVDYILHIMYWSYDLLGQVTGSQFKPSCSHWNLRSIKVSSVAPSQFQIWREAKASQYILKYYNIILGETWGNDCRMFMVRIKYCSKGCVPN